MLYYNDGDIDDDDDSIADDGVAVVLTFAKICFQKRL